jgi:hypothetical protein
MAASPSLAKPPVRSTRPFDKLGVPSGVEGLRGPSLSVGADQSNLPSTKGLHTSSK